MKKTNIVPIFFASDKNYLPYLAVSIASLVDKSTANNQYEIYILTHDLTAEDILPLSRYKRDNVNIQLVDVTEKIESIKDKVALRDYFTVSIYFRLFIPTLFPQYKKGIYLDADITLNRDIAEMFNTDIGDNYLGAVLDEVIWSSDDFTYYARNALDLTEKQYFNSGVLIMNLEKFRNNNIEEDFYSWVSDFYFGTVAPDQDYLNCICKNKVKYLDAGWNKMPMGEKLPDDKLYLIHYNMFTKPWKYYNVMYEDYFWKYAKETPYYDLLKAQQAAYTQEQRDNDTVSYNNLVKMALNIANSNRNYKNIVVKKLNTEEQFDLFGNAIPQKA